jgi:hypothetical protein
MNVNDGMELLKNCGMGEVTISVDSEGEPYVRDFSIFGFGYKVEDPTERARIIGLVKEAAGGKLKKEWHTFLDSKTANLTNRHEDCFFFIGGASQCKVVGYEEKIIEVEKVVTPAVTEKVPTTIKEPVWDCSEGALNAG